MPCGRTIPFGASRRHLLPGLLTAYVAPKSKSLKAHVQWFDLKNPDYKEALVVSVPDVLAAGFAFPESPRWHEGRLWLCDWGAGEVLAIDLAGNVEVVARIQSFPMSIDWLPDGRLLVLVASEGRLATLEADGTLKTYADLTGLSDQPWNELVIDGRGNAYVNNIGFNFPEGEFAAGFVALVKPGGSARQVAAGVAFPNGMAITPDNRTLILAESYGNALSAFSIEADGSLGAKRTWAELGEGAPDGICLDAEGAVWYADVPNRCCARVREGGEVLQGVALDRGGFACALGGAAGRTLFIVTNVWGEDAMASGAPRGQVLVMEAGAPAAGWS